MEFLEGLDDIVAEGTREAMALTEERRTEILHVLHEWVTAHLVTAQDPAAGPRRLAQVESFVQRLNALCAEGGLEIELNPVSGELKVLPGNGEAQTTLILLRRGTPWFEGCDGLEELIASAIF